MIEKENYYVEGSAARQIKYDIYEENTVLKKKKQYRDNRAAKFRLVMSLLAVFAAGLIITYRFAVITQLNYEITRSEKEYNDLVGENSRLRVEVENNTDLVRIKEVAEQKLGMSEPDKHQIVTIRVPRNDYTVVLNPDKTGKNVFSPVLDRLAGVMNFLF